MGGGGGGGGVIQGEDNKQNISLINQVEISKETCFVYVIILIGYFNDVDVKLYIFEPLES